MQPPTSPSSQPQPSRVSEMEPPHPHHPPFDETSTIWEWGSLLDFNLDDQLNISWSPDLHQTIQHINNPHPPPPTEPAGSVEESSDKVRKRDPRLTCENYLAGIVPCACPELDEKMEEEGELRKKRARKGSSSSSLVGVGIRCQVPGCEVDISELKGYHRRHRVCLGCANAVSVVLEGETKRYCQQCGKFHIISDFDEGKRSCRRKLEWHNKRRRRKSTDYKGAVDKQSSGDITAQSLDVDAEEEKENLCSSDQRVDEPLVETEDGHVSPICSVPSSQDIRSDSGITSLHASGESQKDHGKDTSNLTLSSSFCDNKSAYSSMCPTGRISFKLYDWNPAEFPRRLRHQIFQWLSSMPVELEGYIRPGCIILTVFIAMPRFMWEKLSEDGASYINNFVSTPDNLLFGRGRIIVYLNDMIFRTPKGGTSLANVEVEMLAPRLHYVNPTYFEAGEPMEFVACGSNLLQPKFRFLVSFAGKYLVCDSCLSISHGKTESCHGDLNRAQSCDHQVYKIHIRSTEQKFYGPAFIEVETEFGLSNFIPVLLGDRQTCSEMQMLGQRLDRSLYSKMSRDGGHDATSESCEVLVLRQTSISELILDVAWLLKEPKLKDEFVTSADFQRLNRLLGFLIQSRSTFILRKVLQSLGNIIDVKESSKPVCSTNVADMGLFQKYIVRARELVSQRAQHQRQLVQYSESFFLEEDFVSHSNTGIEILYSVPSNNQDKESVLERLEKRGNESHEKVPLLNRDVVMNVNHHQPVKSWPTTSCRRILSSTATCSRPLAVLVTVAVLCSGICAVLLHPQKVGEIAVSIRRCMSGYPNS